METRTVVAEFIGTAMLVLFGVGSLVLAGDYINALGISLAFGFTLIAIAYAFGRVSGCHINPAVTLGVLLAKRIDIRTAVEYWIAQFVGAIVGAAVLFLVAKQVPRLQTAGAFGSNGYGVRSPVGLGAGGAFLAEVLLTFLLVFVFLTVTRSVVLVGVEPVPVGLAYAAANLVGIPLTWASVNPARSFGPAIFAGGDALGQLWLFIVAPLVGGVLAAVVHRFTHLRPEGQVEREQAHPPPEAGPWGRLRGGHRPEAGGPETKGPEAA
ncbi:MULTISPECIES: MIP/aquaporin family protein [Streptomyces]|uniref:Aquaporin Z n=1 Tax=Streptomyces hygroscopicus TaxID=1912 RepID=A0ABQ3UA53_STRHY|nr:MULTISPECIES: aquaporin [Streptomyces]MBW8090109.1 aquaporin [Streptomyces hygroscopicus subsp. hygroscopicus]MCO8306457.1 aquaporin [Streptomyces sp. RKCA744]MDN3060024.1 aquaporin [Streptomyces sp. SRF1]GHJ32484.1 aquaporin Z [Streptomyces hygroscopicus]